MATAKIKVSDLAKKLGMTNAELLELCKVEQIAAKGPSSPLVDAFAQLLERKAKAQGLVRDAQPEEAKPAKATKTTATKSTTTKSSSKTTKTSDDGATDADASTDASDTAPAPAKKTATKKVATDDFAESSSSTATAPVTS
ncbi:MAG: hypothetical protein ACO29A_06915, partial [Ilumatobacteraceae bacterium]